MDPRTRQAGNDAAAGGRFLPVPVDSIDCRRLDMDLYLRHGGGPPALYRAVGVEFTPDDLARLSEQGVKFLFIPAAQHAAYRRSLTDRLTHAFKDPTIAAAERGRIVRASCGKIIEDVLLLAGEGEPVEAVSEVSRTFASWVADDPRGFSYLLDMSEHDFGTVAHMVNVGLGCGLLARELSPGDVELFQIVVQGGLLHDIGKRGIPVAVLNKEGKLEPEEWKLMAAHPMRGHQELRKNARVPEPILSIVRDHHEHLNGAGYPQGLRDEQISLPARICAVVDVFDAITASRPYRAPTHPAETLKIMATARGDQFDAEIFDAFASVVNAMLKADPDRTSISLADGPQRTLAELLPHPPIPLRPSAPTPAGASRKQRRRFDRYPCAVTAKAVFHHQAKRLPIKPGESFALRIVDLGRGGVQSVTPWALSIGDTLTLEFSIKKGPRVTRRAKVVRVSKRSDGQWSAGLAFVETARDAAAA